MEGAKLRQLLAYEETRRCNLEGTLDQANEHARDQQRSLQSKVSIHCLISQPFGKQLLTPVELNVHELSAHITF